ncbi:MAG: hypothetical protein ACLTDB_10675, partial [[Ruminococcus] torques]
ILSIESSASCGASFPVSREKLPDREWFRHFVPSRWLHPPCAAKAAIPCGLAAGKFESEELNFMEQTNRDLEVSLCMK